MNQRTWWGLAAVTIWALSAPAQAYPGGGNPNDQFSCYGKCGARSPVSGAVKCYCDTDCNGRGDCCADRNEFCGPAAAKPACSLTSPNGFGNFCGTDLGFVYQHAGALEILFGDTWEWPSDNHEPLSVPEGYFETNLCFDRAFTGGAPTDDAQGWIPLDRPPTSMGIPQRAASLGAATGAACGPILSLDMDSNNPDTFQAIRLLQGSGSNLVEVPMPPAYTPLAGFSDGSSAYGVFSALRDDNKVHVHIARRTGGIADYLILKDLGADSKFLSPSVARITSYNAFAPNTNSNFATPTSTPGIMLMFGRPKFFTAASESVSGNGLYLLKQALPLGDSSSWQPEYFYGLNSVGAPTWTGNANLAKPVFVEDFKVTEQIDIKWVPEMGKWLMLYGGDVEHYWNPPPNDQPRHGAIHMRLADYPWGPWSRATPLLWREDMGPFIKCDALRPLAGGKGCEPPPPTNPYPQECPNNYTYHPGDFIAGRKCSVVENCVADLPQPVQPNACTFPTPLSPHQRGELYAANLIPTWTNPGTLDSKSMLKTTTIYFTVSTWMPYQVLIAAADIKLPVKTLGQFKVQLRDYQNKMIAVNSQTVSTTPGMPATSWLVTSATGVTNRGPVVGDTVAFMGVDGSGTTRWLARDGNRLKFPAYAGNAPADAQWVLESTDDTDPTGTPIVIGKTRFKLLSVSSGSTMRHLKSTPTEGVRAYAGSGDTADWTFNWGCLSDAISGDVCPQR